MLGTKLHSVNDTSIYIFTKYIYIYFIIYNIYIYAAIAYTMTMWLKHIYDNHIVKVILDILDILFIF